MKKIFFFLILMLPGMASDASSEVQKRNITPQNVAEFQTKFASDSSQNVVCSVTHADFIDWKTVRPEIYEDIYARISEDFFLGRFSMKFGFRLEPFLPLLLPQNPEQIQTEQKIQEKITEIKSGINQVLHEIHIEFFLLPLFAWCSENHVQLEYEILADSSIPVSFLIEEALLVRHISTSSNEGISRRLAVSIARQNGILTLNQQPVCYSKERTVLLFPDSTSCGEIENILDQVDFLSEFQVPYATVQLSSNLPTVGWGAASWNTVQLTSSRETYKPETRNFLDRFESLGGKILERTKKNEKFGEKE